MHLHKMFGLNITPEAIVGPIIMLGARLNLQSFTPKK